MFHVRVALITCHDIVKITIFLLLQILYFLNVYVLLRAFQMMKLISAVRKF